LNQQEQTEVEDGISSILNSMITTSINKDYGEIDPEDKISIVFQEFSHSVDDSEETGPIIPAWVYIVGGILLVAIIIALVMWRRSRNRITINRYRDTRNGRKGIRRNN